MNAQPSNHLEGFYASLGYALVVSLGWMVFTGELLPLAIASVSTLAIVNLHERIAK